MITVIINMITITMIDIIMTIGGNVYFGINLDHHYNYRYDDYRHSHHPDRQAQ